MLGALRAFEDDVRSGDFELANRRLNELTNVLDTHWPRLEASERSVLDESVKAGLHWARNFVTASREQMRAQMDRLDGAKVYQMSGGTQRSGYLTLVG